MSETIVLRSGEQVDVQGIVAIEFQDLKAEVKRAEHKAAKAKTDTYERRKSLREADRQLDAEERAANAVALRGQIPASESLADLLADPPEAEEYAVDGLLQVGGRGLFVAARKSGKTTARNELVRSFADGVPFLGYFPTRAKGKVTVIDTEMSRGQTYRWLADLGIENTEAAHVVSLRGRAATFDVTDAATRAIWAEILAGSDVVILDCLRPILDALGLSENTDAGQFLVAFDALLAEAGVSEALVIDHAGHGNDRARGDSRKEDWADVLWYLEMDDRQDPDSERKFRAMGRDVGVAQGVVEFDHETRHLTYVPPVPDAATVAKDREVAVRSTKARAAVAEWVREQNGIGVEPTKRDTESYSGEGLPRAAVRAAVKDLLKSGELRIEHKANAHRLTAVDPLTAVPLKAPNPFVLKVVPDA